MVAPEPPRCRAPRPRIHQRRHPPPARPAARQLSRPEVKSVIHALVLSLPVAVHPLRLFSAATTSGSTAVMPPHADAVDPRWNAGASRPPTRARSSQSLAQCLVYHHSHVNVEAQMASGSSLLPGYAACSRCVLKHPCWAQQASEVCESTHERGARLPAVDHHECDSGTTRLCCVNNLPATSRALTLPEELRNWETRPVRQRFSRHRTRHDHTCHAGVGDFFWLISSAAPRRHHG